jgi:hypothetical protein
MFSIFQKEFHNYAREEGHSHQTKGTVIKDIDTLSHECGLM